MRHHGRAIDVDGHIASTALPTEPVVCLYAPVQVHRLVLLGPQEVGPHKKVGFFYPVKDRPVYQGCAQPGSVDLVQPVIRDGMPLHHFAVPHLPHGRQEGRVANKAHGRDKRPLGWVGARTQRAEEVLRNRHIIIDPQEPIRLAPDVLFRRHHRGDSIQRGVWVGHALVRGHAPRILLVVLPNLHRQQPMRVGRPRVRPLKRRRGKCDNLFLRVWRCWRLRHRRIVPLANLLHTRCASKLHRCLPSRRRGRMCAPATDSVTEERCRPWTYRSRRKPPPWRPQPRGKCSPSWNRSCHPRRRTHRSG